MGCDIACVDPAEVVFRLVVIILNANFAVANVVVVTAVGFVVTVVIAFAVVDGVVVHDALLLQLL